MRSILRSAVVVGLLAISGPAVARSEKTFAYERDAVWPTAVRFLIVDEKLKVTEKDAETGYALFELKEEGKTFRGSLEVMTVVVEGRTLTRFIIQIEDRPSWKEIAMMTRLEQKLRAEHGAPSPPPTKKDKPPEGGPRDTGPTDRPTDNKPSPPPTDNGPPISDTP